MVYPPFFVQAVAVGEETGSLETALNSLASAMEEEAESKLSGVLTLLEPAIILMVGGIVLLLAISLLQPLYMSLQALG